MKRKNMNILLVIMGLFIILSISPAMAADDNTLADSGYPKYQGDNQNSGQSPYTGPQNNQTKWNYTLNTTEGLSASPSVGPDGTIYLPTYINQNNGGKYADLKAINPNGTLKWNYTFKSGSYNYFTGTPAIAKDGTIYAPGVIMLDSGWAGFMLAINPDGTLKWNYTITDPISNQGSSYNYAPPAIGPDGTIYFTGEVSYHGITGRLYALNPNGTLKWQKTINQGYYTYLRTSTAVAKDGTIIIAPFYYNNVDHTSVIYAFNPDGSEKWNFAYTHTWITGLAIANDGTIYAVGKYNGDKGIVYALNSDGTPKWNYTTNYPIDYNPVIGYDGTIYFGEGMVSDTLYALNPDGTIKWSLEVQPVTSPVIGPDGTLYVGIVSLDPQLGRSISLLAMMNPPSNQDDPDDTIPDNENPNNTVNAASETISMQETGLPLPLIVLAIFMVLGGLIGTKRK